MPSMDKPEQNPFEASQVSATEGADASPPRRMSLLLVIPLVTLSSVVAFCCSCFPISLFTFSLLYPAARPSAEILFFGGWVIAGVVAFFVGSRVWNYLRRPREESE